jgi:hypothetical protein
MSTINDTVDGLKDRLKKLDADYTIDRDALVRAIKLVDPTATIVPKKPFVNDVGMATTSPTARFAARLLKGINSKTYGSIGKAVKAVVLSMEGEFTKGDVDQKLREQYPEIAHRVNGSLANYLWIYSSRDKIIRVIQKSNGREQAKYVKI